MDDSPEQFNDTGATAPGKGPNECQPFALREHRGICELCKETPLFGALAFFARLRPPIMVDTQPTPGGTEMQRPQLKHTAGAAPAGAKASERIEHQLRAWNRPGITPRYRRPESRSHAKALVILAVLAILVLVALFALMTGLFGWTPPVGCPSTGYCPWTYGGP
jgi:hypothetical protein